MKKIRRTLEKQINAKLHQGRVIILYGPRQSGKTTLCRSILSRCKGGRYFLCDNPDVKAALTHKTASELRDFLGDSGLVILDEAQNVVDIGVTLKLLIDTYPKLQIIATGSSSFDLSNRVVEPLTGRKYEFTLFPLSYQEIVAHEDRLAARRKLERILRYGLYPDIYLHPEASAQELVEEIKSAYLFKDILAYQEVKNSEALSKLLQLLALQIGQEVSYSELSKKTGIDIKTVQRYLDLLEKIFVVKKLPALSRNARSEVTKSRKFYFYDLGIRNALIRNFNPLELRQDVGGLWENFCVMEKMKQLSNNRRFANFFFWRTWQQQEIDFVIEADGKMQGFEFKWSKKKIHVPKTFLQLYPGTQVQGVHAENIESFLLEG